MASSFLSKLMRLRKPAFIYDMDSQDDKRALVDMLWTGKYHAVLGRFATANPDFLNLLEQQCVISSEADATAPIEPRRPPALKGPLPRFESVLSSIFRWRNQKMVTLEVAALSIRFLHYRVPYPAWETMVFFTRSVMSRTWTESICELALERDPGAGYTTSSAITGGVFDNCTITVGYGSYATIDKKGERFYMTNWATLHVPESAAPGCSAPVLRALRMSATGIFRDDISLTTFVRSFSLVSPAIVANQQSRWQHYLFRASQHRLDERPNFDSPYPPSHFSWHPPIKDRLQSSYDDVNFEIDYIRRHPMHASSEILMLGGDGLTYMRMIARLAQNPRFYLFNSERPTIVPRLGEHPHGTYHVMHGDWRIWWPFIQAAAKQVDNKQIVADPLVSQFNESEHFLRILT